MTIDLTSQTILVTGASRGIGAEIARHLHAAGAHVIVHYGRSATAAEALASELGSRVTLLQANLERAEAADELFAAAVAVNGRVHTLVNNAGVSVNSGFDAPLATFVDDWDTTMHVNLRASGVLSRAAVNHFRKKGEGGRIVNIASRAAFRGDTKDYVAYAASKGGMVAMTRSIARAYGKDGIKAFTIAPGWVMTDMAKQFMDEGGAETILSELALPTLTQPSDVAPTVVFLSSGLSDHATGCTIDINAGSYVH